MDLQRSTAMEDYALLLVEDDEHDAKHVLRLLGESMNPHFRVVRAKSLKEAQDCLSGATYDLVLLDLQLHDSRGIWTFRTIRDDFPQAAIVVMSGAEDQALATEAVRNGAQDYLVKTDLLAHEMSGRLLQRALTHAIIRTQALVKLRTMSLTDELTQLLNRRGFETLGQQTIDRARRENQLICCVYFDLDDLKRINDTLGHESGDEAIRQAATAFRSMFRQSDIVARLGGDEFAALTLIPDRAAKQALTNRIEEERRIIESRSQSPFQLSFSYGAVVCSAHDEECVKKLFQETDRMMYLEKRSRKVSSPFLQRPLLQP